MAIIEGYPQTPGQACWLCPNPMECAAFTQCLRKKPLTRQEQGVVDAERRRLAGIVADAEARDKGRR